MSDPLTAIEVTVSRVITDTGELAVRISTPADYSGVEVIGLLEVAKLHVFDEKIRGNSQHL